MNNPTMLTPVTTLMCEDLRLSSILTDTGPIHKKEMQLFLSLVEDVMNRWYSALGKIRPNVYYGYNEDIGTLSNLNHLFTKVSTIDDESIFDVRRQLHSFLEDFYKIIDHMAEVFTGPQPLKECSFNINSRLMSTTETILEGKNGW